MKYSKPEIVQVRSAVEAIEWNLSKNVQSTDAQGGDYTASSAYQSDE
jgi:hypothetical protein